MLRLSAGWRSGPVLRVLSALSLSGVVAVAAAELVLRLLGLAPVNGVATVTEREFARLPGILAPRQHLVDRRKPSLPHWVTTDSLGFRGPDFPRLKPPGEFRMLLTGDSFIYGDFVDDAETLPAQLERTLSARCRGVRVINAGLGGATITDEVELVQRALPLTPDLVVVVFSENDVTDLGQTPMWTLLAANRRAKSRFPLSLVYPVLRHTALWNLGLEVAGKLRAPREMGAVTLDPSTHDPAPILRLRDLYRRALERLRDTLTAHRIPLAVAAYPSHLTVSGSQTAEQVRWIAGLAEAEGITAFDLLAPLRDSGLPTTRLYLLPYDGHPSRVGYDLAAAYLADRLPQTKLLSASCH